MVKGQTYGQTSMKATRKSMFKRRRGRRAINDRTLLTETAHVGVFADHGTLNERQSGSLHKTSAHAMMGQKTGWDVTEHKLY